MKSVRIAGPCLVLLFAGLLIGCRAPLPKSLRMVFLDVGQGDCTVIETPGGQVVVIDGGGIPATLEKDGGDPGHRVLMPYLRYQGISRIDVLVATHPDEDHVQGLAAVAGHMPIGRAFLGGDFSRGAAARLRRTLGIQHVPTASLRRGQSIALGDGIRLDIVHPGRTRVPNSRSPDNDHGIVMRLQAGRSSALLTGDIEDAAEKQVLESGIRIDSQLLKVAHHGSRGSSGNQWIDRVKPRWAVISAGRQNRFGHPSPATLRRLERSGVVVLRTDELGAIVAESTGSGWSFRTGPDGRPWEAGGGLLRVRSIGSDSRPYPTK